MKITNSDKNKHYTNIMAMTENSLRARTGGGRYLLLVAVLFARVWKSVLPLYLRGLRWRENHSSTKSDIGGKPGGAVTGAGNGVVSVSIEAGCEGNGAADDWSRVKINCLTELRKANRAGAFFCFLTKQNIFNSAVTATLVKQSVAGQGESERKTGTSGASKWYRVVQFTYVRK